MPFYKRHPHESALLSGKQFYKCKKTSPHSALFQRKLEPRPFSSESWKPSSAFKSGSLGQAQGKGLGSSFRWNDANGVIARFIDSFRTTVRESVDDAGWAKIFTVM